MDTQITKLCPQCNHSMMRAGKFFFCAECGCSAPFEETKKVDVEKQYPSRYVFLSYGHDQYATFAHKLKDDLIKRGHIVWTDQELKIGNDWETNIEEALNKAINNKPNSCFLLLMSPYSIRRPDGYCLNELAKAIRWGIFTLPIRLDQVEPPLSIARVQVLDMSECVCPEEVEAIYQRQLNLLFNALENDQIDFDGTQAYLINKLQPIEFKSEVKKYLQDFTGRQWILDTINTWLSDENGSRVFWLTGGPGVGKTAISLWLSCKSLPNIHAWHLCQHSDSITSDPRKCILSLAYYLSTHLPDYFEKLKELNLDEMINSANVNALFTRLLIEPLKELKPRETPIVILIDAIDESTTENGDNPIAKFIGSHFNDFPTWVRLIITSRPVYEVEKWFKCLNPQVLHTTDERNLNDISLYIQNRLKKHSFSTDVSESITRSILQRSEGVFLYAEFICNSIDSKEIDPLDINHFPKGLYNVYEDYFQRRFPDIQQYKTGVAHLLRLIVAAKEPLLIDDINNFLESKLDDWDEECFEDMRKSLGSLFVLIDDTIVPFHKSIIDWLVQNRESDYYINRKKANRNMIEWGERMIKSRRGVSEYFLKHLLAHYVYDKQFDSAIDLLQNQIYFNLQVAMLGFDQTIRLYFDNLLLFHDYSPQSVEIGRAHV